ncbi:MAG: hypothetical protein ACLGJC_33845 [Alphaproteobacteria bacterium]
MTDIEDSQARKQRSPSSPFIPLKRAVQRAEEFFRSFKRHPARVPDVVTAWGYELKSSGGLQTIAALKQFGLLDDIGLGEARRLKLSDLAMRILEDQRAGAKQKALADAALRPRLIAEYFEIWGYDRPTSQHCISELKFEKNFNDDAARRFLSVYDETIPYARVAASDKLTEPEEDVPALVPSVEVDTMDAAVTTNRGGPSSPPTHLIAPQTQPANLLAGGGGRWHETLRDEGGSEIVINFGAEPTAETYEFLRDYLEFKLKRMAKRSVKPAERPPEDDDLV